MFAILLVIQKQQCELEIDVKYKLNEYDLSTNFSQYLFPNFSQMTEKLSR